MLDLLCGCCAAFGTIKPMSQLSVEGLSGCSLLGIRGHNTWDRGTQCVPGIPRSLAENWCVAPEFGAVFLWQHAIAARNPEFAFFQLNGVIGFLVFGMVLAGI